MSQPHLANAASATRARLGAQWRTVAEVALASLPVVNIVWIITATGANNVSNDYLAYVPILEQILNGSYAWVNYFRDTYWNGHSMVVLVLAHWATAALVRLNVYVEMYLGVALALARLALTYDMLAKAGGRRPAAWLLPALAALIFSTSQITVFTYGDAALALQVPLFGLALGLWGLVRFAKRWQGVALAATGGLLAAWAWGTGPVVWPVALLGLVLCGFRQRRHYLAFLAVGAVAALPYIYFNTLARGFGPGATPNPGFNIYLIVDLLGRPFANGLGRTSLPLAQAALAGWLGLALAGSALALWLVRRPRCLLAPARPALLWALFGLLTATLIAVFRGNVAEWYMPIAITFWVGLVGLAHTALAARPASPRPAGGGLARLWGAALLATVAVLYLQSNLTYTDKTLLLYARSPASASCLRHYASAPTYCEGRLFQWGLGWPHYLGQLGAPLERRGLNVFAPRQTWTLQGDYILPAVQVTESLGGLGVFWSANPAGASLTEQAAGLACELANRAQAGACAPPLTVLPWWDYQHLDLNVAPGSEVTWTVTLPANVQSAELRTAINGRASLTGAPLNAVMRYEVFLERAGAAPVLVIDERMGAQRHRWRPIRVPLTDYAGQTITLRFTTRTRGESVPDWGVYRYPTLALVVPPGSAPATPPVLPSNTNLSPLAAQPTPADVVFDLRQLDLWELSPSVAPAPDTADGWLVGEGPYLDYNGPVNVCAADFTHVYFEMAVPPGGPWRVARLFYRLNDDPLLWNWVDISLLADGDLHAYTYELKLFELAPGDRITDIRLDPPGSASADSPQLRRVANLRLLRGDSSPGCDGG